MVTTVIPTYRRPPLLKRAVRSALNQTRDDLIVSVFDNASGDETPRIVADFMKGDPRVQYFCQPENIGMVKNFQYGMSRVQTPYFSFLSDDDLILPGLYEEAIEALEREPSAMFFAAATIYLDFDGNFTGQTLHGWQSGVHYPPAGLYSILRAGNPFWTSVVFRHEAASQVGLLPDAGLVSDRDFLIRIAARFPFVVSKTPGAVFFSNPASPAAHMTISELWNGGLTIIQNMNEVLAQEFQMEALRLFQRELGNRIASFGQIAAMNGGRKEAQEAIQLLENRLDSHREASRIKLMVALSGFGLNRPLRFGAKCSRSLRHLPTSLRRLVDRRKYKRTYEAIVTELLQST